jgi:branched-chain amino acid transport system substrate-binding protein
MNNASPRTKEESMRRIRAGHAAVAAAVLLLALVVGATSGLGASDRSTGFKLTIGDIEAYTGDLGSLGAPADKAVKLGVQQLNAAAKKARNGNSFSLVTADTQTDPQNALSAARQVVGKGATCLTGPLSTPESIAVLNGVTKVRRIPMFPTATSTKLREADDAHTIFRTAPPDDLQARALVTAVAQAVGGAKGKTVALGYLNLPYGVGIYQVFSKGWEALGGKIVAVGYSEEQASYDSEAQKLVAANPAAFVFADYPDTFGKVGAALLRTGKYSASKAFFSDTLALSSIPSTIPAEALNGSYVTAAGSPSGTAQAKAFNKLYKSTSGPKTGALLPNSFDSAILCGLAAVAAHSNNPAKIVKQIPKISGPTGKPYTYLQLAAAMKAVAAGKHIHYIGVSGPINFNARGDTTAALYDLSQWTNGKLVLKKQLNVK